MNLKVSDKETLHVSERENMDVAWLMSMAADKNTVDSWTANLLKRASRLLRETTGFCSAAMTLLGEERLLKAIFKEGHI